MQAVRHKIISFPEVFLLSLKMEFKCAKNDQLSAWKHVQELKENSELTEPFCNILT